MTELVTLDRARLVHIANTPDGKALCGISPWPDAWQIIHPYAGKPLCVDCRDQQRNPRKKR